MIVILKINPPEKSLQFYNNCLIYKNKTGIKDRIVNKFLINVVIFTNALNF